jgi:hypothetical protein
MNTKSKALKIRLCNEDEEEILGSATVGPRSLQDIISSN